MPIGPTPFDPRLAAILAEDGFDDTWFNARRHAACELVDAYVAARAVEVLHALVPPDRLHTWQSFDDLHAAAATPDFGPQLRWLFEWLTARGLLERQDTPLAYRQRAGAPALDPAALRDEALAIDPSFEPAFTLADETAAAYPRVARGDVTGERALFHRILLWVSYFSNTNGYYALNNRVTAMVAADCAGGPIGRILELGAGLGSATEALLAELTRRGHLGALTAYHATEPVPFFRRRAERTLRADWPTVPFQSGTLDLSQPWRVQADCPAPVDLVWAVNVFHLAYDLDAALREAFATLVPGGWLVLGEGIRPRVGRPVAAEFPFQLLSSFTSVRLDPDTRPEAGFLTAEHWLAAMTRAGFEAVRLVPDVVRLRAVHETFYATAVCGRRPA
jgi:SAM-dependent methyltransferase